MTRHPVMLLARAARPAHWVKNLIVFFPMVFGRQMQSPQAWAHVLLAFVAFCLVSSFGYILNDLRDRPRDRLHERKRTRPIASGDLSPAMAMIEAVVLLAAGLAVAWSANPAVLVILAAYVVLQSAYSVGLKHVMLLDVIAISAGFVLRAAAGAVAIPVWVSPWLIVCTFTLCLFLGFCKRRAELADVANGVASAAHRRTLAGYTPELLTHLITLSATIAIVSYLIYSTHEDTVARFGTIGLVYTLPVVIYCVCRFAMRAMADPPAEPIEIILRDRAFQAGTLLWLAAVAIIVYRGAAIQQWASELFG